MRSVLLTSTFAPSLGGIETLLYETSRRMAEPPAVVAPAPSSAADLEVHQVRLSLGNRLVYRPAWRVHPTLHYLHAFWRPSVQAIRAHRPRVLLAGHVFLAPLAWVLARRLDLPFVAFAYGQEVWRGGARVGVSPLDALLRGKALRSAARVLVPGSFTSRLLADWNVASERMVAVPYGADPRPWTDPPDNETTVLSVARLVRRKGIDTVISALRELPPDVVYRVVGTGPDEPRLRALAWSMGVSDRVHFLGRLDNDALTREYQASTVFVLPSRVTDDCEREGYGLVYFEAAACGRPVVAGMSGGEVDAVVDGHTGVLVDGASTDAVRDALAALLVDPERRARLGRAGWKRVNETHNWACAARVVDATLQDVA
ncbi:MAG: glycosyltransferase family 4 protein [Chloroflexota bacterium]